jgi:hypothetical protein
MRRAPEANRPLYRNRGVGDEVVYTTSYRYNARKVVPPLMSQKRSFAILVPTDATSMDGSINQADAWLGWIKHGVGDGVMGGRPDSTAAAVFRARMPTASRVASPALAVCG